MDRYHDTDHTNHPYDGVTDGVTDVPENQLHERPNGAPVSYSDPAQPASYHPSASSIPNQMPSQGHSDDVRLTDKLGLTRPGGSSLLKAKKLDKKWQRRLYWIVPLCILAIVLVVLFEIYKDDFERWVKPLADWLTKREAWSWVIPVVILFILSFPPLFGHEIVQIVVGLSYPLGVAIGIACAGAILGEAGCFLVFKYGFTWWVDKKIATKIRWAAIARVAQKAGFRGVLVIRYSIVPPHLANPLFSCTGMKFWLYMITVILSLPKSIVFVALGAPVSKNSKGAKWAKVVAIGVVVLVTLFASVWIHNMVAIATEEIEAERGISRDDEEQGDEELGMLGQQTHSNGTDETAYHGAANTTPYPYEDAAGLPLHQRV